MSDETQHTPGPWRADWFDERLLIDALHADSTKLVAEVCRAQENPMVNARLIAAAPDLLEAAKKTRDHLATFAQTHSHVVPETLLIRLDNAIAKAEGRNYE